jgi:hypothetical protein
VIEISIAPFFTGINFGEVWRLSFFRMGDRAIREEHRSLRLMNKLEGMGVKHIRAVEENSMK